MTERELQFYPDEAGNMLIEHDGIIVASVPAIVEKKWPGMAARLAGRSPAPQSGMGDEVERALKIARTYVELSYDEAGGEEAIEAKHALDLIDRALSTLPRAVLTPEQAGRDARQATVVAWASAAFGTEQTTNIEQRGLRLAEETIEACQAAGCDAAMLHKLIDYVYSRPVGAVAQELGGVGLCTLAMANAAGLSADAIEQAEVARVLAKPIQMFSARNKDKNDAGFLASALNRATDGDGK